MQFDIKHEKTVNGNYINRVIWQYVFITCDLGVFNRIEKALKMIHAWTTLPRWISWEADLIWPLVTWVLLCLCWVYRLSVMEINRNRIYYYDSKHIFTVNYIISYHKKSYSRIIIKLWNSNRRNNKFLVHFGIV